MAPARSPGQKGLVGTVAARIRDRVFAGAPDDRMGSLADLAAEFGVGIVTVQQAARILEHEGLLEVRRGPGGGYFGRRPDQRTLERALSAYMRMHPDSWSEALDITSLLFIELCGAAAASGDAACRAELEALGPEIARCETTDELGRLEYRLQETLFRMVDRPIFELLTRVTIRFAAAGERPPHPHDHDRVQRWVAGRLRIISAIVERDKALARFEADRGNRQQVLASLHDPG